MGVAAKYSFEFAKSHLLININSQKKHTQSASWALRMGFGTIYKKIGLFILDTTHLYCRPLTHELNRQAQGTLHCICVALGVKT